MFLVNMQVVSGFTGKVSSVEKQVECSYHQLWRYVSTWLKSDRVLYGEIFDDVNQRLFSIESENYRVKRIDL